MATIDKVEICKLVAHAILADTRITDEEQEFLDKLMDRYELDDMDRKAVLNRDIDEDPEDGLMMLATDESRNELLVELALAVAVDGEISSSERALLNRIAAAMNVSEADMELMLKAAIA